MMYHILIYIRDFPSNIHHPAEYAVFSAMANNSGTDKKFRGDVDFLMKDHAEIENMLFGAIKTVESMLTQKNPDARFIGSMLAAIINKERAHLMHEEVNIYPYIAEHSDSKAWETISALTPDYEDPIFGGKVKKEYEPIVNAL